MRVASRRGSAVRRGSGLALGLLLCALVLPAEPVAGQPARSQPAGGSSSPTGNDGGTAAPSGDAPTAAAANPAGSPSILDFGAVLAAGADPATGGVAAPEASRAAPVPRWAPAPLFAALGAAATVHTDLPCYFGDRVVTLTGSGLPPGTTYTVALDGVRQGVGRVSREGQLSGRLPSGPAPAGGEHQRVLTVRGAAGRLSVSFAVTPFAAGFSPPTSKPSRQLVRFSALGFGLGTVAGRGQGRDPAARAVYVHYLDPAGRDRADVLVGHTAGACGSLGAGPILRLFPFNPGPGTWRLQFDVSAAYSQASAPRMVRTLIVA